MNSFAVSLITFACIVGGIVPGSLLPGKKLGDDSREVIRLGTGLIGTIAALVLGLLIGSAKSSYDTQAGQIRQLTANYILLDLVLEEYGAETRGIREMVRKNVAVLTERLWHKPPSRNAPEFKVTPEGLAVYAMTQALQPRTEAQKLLQARALQLITETAQTRFLLFAQTDHAIPLPFLVVLVLWLTMIFASFGLFAQPNAAVIGILALFGLSATGAIYLILELSHPFEGLLRIPSEPFGRALPPLKS
jgi:hypothetical protein